MKKHFPGFCAALFFLLGGTAHSQTADTIVATINGTAITFSEIVAFQNTIPSAAEIETKEILPQILKFYIDQKLAIIAAESRGLENKPEVKAQLERLRNETLRQAYLREEIKHRVTPNAIENSYKKQMETAVQELEIKARHILVETQGEAEALLLELSRGVEFAALARDKSIGPSGPQGGDLGWFTAGVMVPEFSQAAFALERGEVTLSPVKTEFGWHLIKIDDRRLKPLPNMEDMLPKIRDQLAEEAVEEAMQELRGLSEIVIMPLS
ncbi:MAG: peptidylprolyl isomerase [Rhodospirillaceae bacterium]